MHFSCCLREARGRNAFEFEFHSAKRNKTKRLRRLKSNAEGEKTQPQGPFSL